MTPTGSSIGAIIVLAIVSHIIKNPAPQRKEEASNILWSEPTNLRTKCGTANPTKPIIPETETATPVSKEEVDKIMESAKRINSSVIIVSTEVGSGIVPANKIAREFRDIMGRVHQTIAKKSNEVYLMTAGVPVKIR